MRRLLIHVEGQTEEEFVNEVLAPHLYNVGYELVGARLLGNARLRERRGGIKDWGIVKRDITRHLAGDAGCIATTMVDYYALPQTWPGRLTAPSIECGSRGQHVQEALLTDILSSGPHGARFEPFVLMHEFEALLFSDCNLFAAGIGQPAKAPEFQAIRDAFPTPEYINDSPDTAPSKRVLKVVPRYQKPLYGSLAAIEVGLQSMRDACPHFGEWLGRLEARVS